MAPSQPLPPEKLYTPCDPDQFDFETTESVKPLEGIVGQDRAVEAVRFGIGMTSDGYNLFAFGPEGTGKASLVRQFLDKKAVERPVPDDWAYVNNFVEPHRPLALRLPPGKARPLANDMKQLIEDLRASIPAAFESDDYRTRRQGLEDEFKETHEETLTELQREASENGVAVIRTPVGLAVAPTRDGDILKPEDFNKLPKEEQERLKKAMEMIQEKLQETFSQMPKWEKEQRAKIRDLDRETTEFVVGHLIAELKRRYETLPDVLAYLDEVHKDVIQNASDFLPQEVPNIPGLSGVLRQGSGDALRRYQVNVIVDNCAQQSADDKQAVEPSEGKDLPPWPEVGAPVIEEENPTQPHLVGRIEHLSQMGALVTDFTMIKPGALHRANGGYLILDAHKLLTQPFSYEALKRALTTKSIRIEAPGESYGLLSTVSLEPEPIPLDLKVILLGEPDIYYILNQYDPEFRELFKVGADFDSQMMRDAEHARHYAALIATVGRRENLKPLDRGGVARVVEEGARMVEDTERLSTHMASIVDLVREADFWASEADAKVIGADHVQKAIDAQIYRSDRISKRMQEMIERDTIVIATEGAEVGQINGLAVYQLDQFAFGKPSRISCRVHMGKGEVIDIEREIALGGPIHSKGVLILSSYLASKYTRDLPLALSANLVFEQSYSGVEGDSASSAELYVLLSAISEIPIKQSFAVTGSVDQHGRVQAIGGVNEKIEGFFDICAKRGLTGEQGVLIPKANVKDLMLRKDVVDAAHAGKFHIYSVESIDQGIEILTGVPAGEADEHGDYPIGTVNRTVAAQLHKMSQKALALAHRPPGGNRHRPLLKPEQEDGNDG